MKFKNILILICSVYFFSGCDDYLDLVPEDDILTIPKIFETRSGAGQWMIDANLLFNMLAIHQTGNPALMGADEYTAGTYARVDKVLTSFYIADGLQTALSPLGDIWDYKRIIISVCVIPFWSISGMFTIYVPGNWRLGPQR